MFGRKKFDKQIEKLESRLFHLENKEKAEKLLEEYRKLAPIHSTEVLELEYWKGGITKAGHSWYEYSSLYSLEEFECKVLCPLRKQELRRLEKVVTESHSTTSGTTTIAYPSPEYDITYILSANKKRKGKHNVRNKRK